MMIVPQASSASTSFTHPNTVFASVSNHRHPAIVLVNSPIVLVFPRRAGLSIKKLRRERRNSYEVPLKSDSATVDSSALSSLSSSSSSSISSASLAATAEEDDEESSRGSSIGSRVRVKASIKVYHVPKVPEFDLTGMEGVLKQYVGLWKGKRTSANLPFKVEFVTEIEGRGTVKFFVHLKVDEFEYVDNNRD